MILRIAFLLALVIGCTQRLSAVQLTLRVDMRGQAISANGVRVAGTFQRLAGYAADWDPSATQMTDPNRDSIYEATVDVPPGQYLFKFVNGTTWPTSEIVPGTCGRDDGRGNINRTVSLGTTALRMPAVPFAGCLPIVRFAVNMQGQAVPPAGVHVMGTFQQVAGYGPDWNPSATPLQDPDQDGIYEADVMLPAAAVFYYRFVNGNTSVQAEVLAGPCASGDGQGTQSRIGSAGSSASSLPRACFGTCDPCGDAVAYQVPWWNDCVFYEIFVRSFYDSDNDGIGDFAGLLAKLDYLNDGNPATSTDLGITGIWFMPINPSPSYHGYDVTDYKGVNSQYGTMAQFEAFLSAARSRGIKVILDMVVNHSSSMHPWFTQSAFGAGSPFRNWYVWANTRPSWGQWVQRNGAFYYTVFGGHMPDFNWRSSAMRGAMYDACRYWLDKGVDGYRLDAVKYLVENQGITEGAPETFTLLRELRDSLIAAKSTAFTVGEVWSSTQEVVPYVQQNRLNTCFDFDLATSIINGLRQGTASGIRDQLRTVNASYPRLQYATFLTNHDQNRVIDVLNGNMAQMRQAAALYLTMPGVPFLYYGEEIAMRGSGVDEDKRKPMQWTSGPNAGFSNRQPWRSINTNYTQFNVARQQADSTSLLNHYKRLIALRHGSDALRRGYYVPASTSADALLGYGRVYGLGAVFMLSNLGVTAVAQPQLSCLMTTLAPGNYTVTELYTGRAAGTITLNAQGGFSNWRPALGVIEANHTWVLRFDKVATIASSAAHAFIGLYPNPANDLVNVDVSWRKQPGTLSVYTIGGKLVHQMAYDTEAIKLDCNAWPTGSYFVRCSSAGQTVTKHLVVVHD